MSSPALPETTPARVAELAPSATAPPEPTGARIAGLMGMMLTVFGLVVVTMNSIYTPRIVGKGWGFVCMAIGIVAVLYHAVRDRDIQIRRAYGLMGYGLLLLLVILSLVNARNFLTYGWACSLAALCFLLCFSKHETEPVWRKRLLFTFAGIGAAMTLSGFVGGVLIEGFLLTHGLLLALLGLIYVCAFITQCESTNDGGHRAGLLLGAVAVFAILYALIRSLAPVVIKMNVAPFFVPTGLLLLFLGAVYGAVALAVVSDNRLVVLTRRELTAFFYSPVAYSVMLGMAFLGGFAYLFFLQGIFVGAIRYEPIVFHYFRTFPPFVVMFVTPAITMRLFAEEKRSGTYEVLMCAPVKETTVVLSKFIACWIFFMLLWAIWSLYLIALQSGAAPGKEFDYRPLLSFYLALGVCGGSFVAMGLFFSSLSGNQIIAAVLTFIGMLLIFLVGNLASIPDVAPIWKAAFRHISYSELWDSSLRGRLLVRSLILQGSFAVFWLFLTVKVLEARRWS